MRSGDPGNTEEDAGGLRGPEDPKKATGTSVLLWLGDPKTRRGGGVLVWPKDPKIVMGAGVLCGPEDPTPLTWTRGGATCPLQGRTGVEGRTSSAGPGGRPAEAARRPGQQLAGGASRWQRRWPRVIRGAAGNYNCCRNGSTTCRRARTLVKAASGRQLTSWTGRRCSAPGTGVSGDRWDSRVGGVQAAVRGGDSASAV